MEPKYKLGDYVWCLEYERLRECKIIYGKIEGIESKYTFDGIEFEYKIGYIINSGAFATYVKNVPEKLIFNTFEEAEKYIVDHLYKMLVKVEKQTFEDKNGKQCNEQYTERFRAFLKQNGSQN